MGNFPLRQWNVFESESYRTNNHLEGWHNRLKRVVGKPHPNIYEFVEVIQREQTTTKVSLSQHEAGAHPSHRALRAINRDRKIKELKARFEGNSLALNEYVRGMSAHTNISSEAHYTVNKKLIMLKTGNINE